MFTSSGGGDTAFSETGASDNTASLETCPIAELDRVIDDLIREHGADAVIHAATRTMSTLDEGAVNLRTLWQRVLETAKQVQREDCGQSGASAEVYS